MSQTAASWVERVDEWLSALPRRDGISGISESRAYAHDEAGYDEQYQSDPANLTVGRGLVNLLREQGAPFDGPALEVGCGTGLVSLGLGAQQAYPLLVITDPSPKFLDITRRKIRAHALDESRLRWAVLMGEEIDRLPEGAWSLIVLRSTLHHIVDVDGFLRAAARALAPAGVLAFQEPCSEGYILMGALVQFLPVLAGRAGKSLTPEQAQRVRAFANAMKFYARRDVDKSKHEDKHLFRVDELMRTGGACGLEVRFEPNMTFDYHGSPTGERWGPDRFAAFFRGYARYCMSWDEGLMRLFDEHLAPFCAYIDELSGGGGGPYMHGVFTCVKR